MSLVTLPRRAVSAVTRGYEIVAELSRCNGKPRWKNLRSLLDARLRHGVLAENYAGYRLDLLPPDQRPQFAGHQQFWHLFARLNPPTHHPLVRHKLNFHRRALAAGLPVPPVLGVVGATATNLAPDFNPLASVDALDRFLHDTHTPPEIVVKDGTGKRGIDLLALQRIEGNWQDVHGTVWTSQALWQHCTQGDPGRHFLVQPHLFPAASLRGIMPGRALGCARIVTLLAPTGARTVFYEQKITRRHTVADNYCNGTTGNLIGGVAPETGRLRHVFGVRPNQRPLRYCVEAFDHHPDTGIPLTDFQLPRWHEILAAACAGARLFPELRCLGWDIALTDAGVVVLEANALWCWEVIQLVSRRSVGGELARFVAQLDDHPASPPSGG